MEFQVLLADRSLSTILAATSNSDLVSRGLHLLAAMVAIGGLAFQRLALRPALEKCEDPELAEAIGRRWAMVTHSVIAVLLLTGLYQLMTIGMAKGKLDSSYHMWFGIKFVAAIGVFFLVSVLGGRRALSAKFRENGRFWLSTTLLLGVGIVAISLALRSYASVAE